jgi:histidinol-phosphate aminotransferase
MYGVLANINAVDNREVLLSEGFQPEVGAILDAVDDNTKMIFFYVNNPTGNSFPMKVWLLYFKILKALWLLMKRILIFQETKLAE